MTHIAELKTIIQEIESWDKKRVTQALKDIQNQPGLTESIRERYQPLLDYVGGKNLNALKTLPTKISGLKFLKKDWAPDPVSAEIIGTFPITEMRISGRKMTLIPGWIGCLSQLKELDLGLNRLTELPEFIGKLHHLQSLKLNENKFTALPDIFGNLKELKVLDLGNTKLTALPASLGDLENLEELRFWGTPLGTLPEPIRKLTKLKKLMLADCELTELPEWIGEIKGLENLDLAHNALSTLPESLGDCAALVTLSVWYCSSVSTLPESLGKLVNLEELVLGYNKLDSLPDSLRALTKLRNLRISGNKFNQVPACISSLIHLENLDFNSNSIQEMPEFIGELTQLKSLDLSSNPIFSLPFSVRKLSQLASLRLYGSGLQKTFVCPDEYETLEEVQAFLRKVTATVDEMGEEAQLFAQLESQDDSQIQAALDLLKENETLCAAAEKRYLSFVQARLNDPDASIQKFAEAALSDAEITLLSGPHVSEYFLTFEYLQDAESKVIVDFLGAMIQGVFDVETYCMVVGMVMENEAEFLAFLKEKETEVKKALTENAAVYAQGWFGKLFGKMCSLKPGKVMFDHSSFAAANKSLVLKAYMFFLSIFSTSDIYFDIFQSDTPDLTPLIWMMKQTPSTAWGDVDPEIPESALPFNRYIKVREGDFGHWKSQASHPDK